MIMGFILGFIIFYFLILLIKNIFKLIGLIILGAILMLFIHSIVVVIGILLAVGIGHSVWSTFNYGG